MQFLMLILFRGLLGAFCIQSLRYKVTIGNIVTGFFVYLSDVTGGLSYLFDMGFRDLAYNPRRFNYALLNIFLLIREGMHAREIFYIRLFAWFVDSVIYESHYSKV